MAEHPEFGMVLDHDAKALRARPVVSNNRHRCQRSEMAEHPEFGMEFDNVVQACKTRYSESVTVKLYCENCELLHRLMKSNGICSGWYRNTSLIQLYRILLPVHVISAEIEDRQSLGHSKQPEQPQTANRLSLLLLYLAE